MSCAPIAATTWGASSSSRLRNRRGSDFEQDRLSVSRTGAQSRGHGCAAGGEVAGGSTAVRSRGRSARLRFGGDLLPRPGRGSGFDGLQPTGSVRDQPGGAGVAASRIAPDGRRLCGGGRPQPGRVHGHRFCRRDGIRSRTEGGPAAWAGHAGGFRPHTQRHGQHPGIGPGPGPAVVRQRPAGRGDSAVRQFPLSGEYRGVRAQCGL